MGFLITHEKKSYWQVNEVCANVVGWPWLDTRCPSQPLYHSPPQVDRGEKIQQKTHVSR